jgi:hypothetical protein
MSFALRLSSFSAVAVLVFTMAVPSAWGVIRVLTDPAAGSGRFYRVRQW